MFSTRMLKRGYIVLLVGVALVVIGIIITAAYGVGIASVILNENIILSNVLVEPSGSVNRTLEITDLERPVSVALHVEANNSADNPVVEQTVFSPIGFIITKNKFDVGGQNDFFTSFKPETDGIYTLSLYNLGADQVKIQGIFGYLPIKESNGELSVVPFTGLISGALLFIIGIGTLVAGAVITVLDRRGDRKRRSLLG
ncbi:MAG: hypothetical protein WBX01_05740 [Nitrososphaeraceae archaeon]